MIRKRHDHEEQKEHRDQHKSLEDNTGIDSPVYKDHEKICGCKNNTFLPYHSFAQDKESDTEQHQSYQ